jgi:uncharacterized membrane protein YciS (DUF1049 family)
MWAVGDRALQIYAVKAFRLMGIYAALTIAIRFHEADYVEQVYGKAMDPPRLNTITVAMAMMMLLVNALIYLSLYIGAKNGGMVSSEVFEYLVGETLFYTTITVLVGYFIANVISQKKYFNYKKDGLRAIRAFKEMVMSVVVPIGLCPVHFGAF